MRKLYLLIIPVACFLSSCSKSASEELSDNAQKKSEEFQTAIRGNKFRLVAFYSDRPIDYITNDAQVKAETDLWSYVKWYLIDDVMVFNQNGTLSINQNEDKMPGSETSVINMSYGCQANAGSVMMNYFDPFYAPLQYKVDEFDNAYFTIFVDGPNGSKLYSKLARVE